MTEATTTTPRRSEAAIIPGEHPALPSPPPPPPSRKAPTVITTQTRRLWNVRGKRFGNPLFVVAGGALTMLGLGTLYAWGTLSVFVSTPGFLTNAPASTTVFVYALSLVMVPVAMMTSTLIQPRIGTMLTAMLGAVIAGIGIMCSAAATTFVALLFSWGITGGFGIGLAYVCCIVLPAQWFPRQKGLVTGLCVGMFGAGSFFFSLIVKAMANPNNVPTRCTSTNTTICDAWREEYHNEMTRTVPPMLLTIGAMSAILGCIGALALQPPPAPSAKSQNNTAAEEDTSEFDLIAVVTVEGPVEVAADNASKTPKSTAVSLSEGVTPIQAFKMPQFWLIWLFISLALTAGMFVVGSYSEFARVEGRFGNVQYDIIGGIGALGNALGRLGWGRMCDWFDWHHLFIVNSLLLATLSFVYQTTISNQVAFGVVTALFFFSYGGFLGILPSASANAFGLKNVSKIYSFLFTSTAVAALLQSILMKVLIASIGFFKLFYLMAGICLAATFVMIAYKPHGRGHWFQFWKSTK